MLHFLHTEAGYNHNNEDAIAVYPHPDDTNVLLCALADGQGGQYGGGRSAQLATEQCLQKASRYPSRALMDARAWEEIFTATDTVVLDDRDAGYTTLISLCVTPERVFGVSSGDSAAILLTSDEIISLTERQQKNPPVGSGAAYPVPFYSRLGTSWQLVIMSDGVWKYVGWETLEASIRQFQGTELIERLHNTVVGAYRGHLPDDFSLIVIHA